MMQTRRPASSGVIAALLEMNQSIFDECIGGAFLIVMLIRTPQGIGLWVATGASLFNSSPPFGKPHLQLRPLSDDSGRPSDSSTRRCSVPRNVLLTVLNRRRDIASRFANDGQAERPFFTRHRAPPPIPRTPEQAEGAKAERAPSEFPLRHRDSR